MKQGRKQMVRKELTVVLKTDDYQRWWQCVAGHKLQM